MASSYSLPDDNMVHAIRGVSKVISRFYQLLSNLCEAILARDVVCGGHFVRCHGMLRQGRKLLSPRFLIHTAVMLPEPRD